MEALKPIRRVMLVRSETGKERDMASRLDMQGAYVLGSSDGNSVDTGNLLEAKVSERLSSLSLSSGLL